MTEKISASAIATIPNFAVLVQQHAADMKHWRGQMARVEADKKDVVPIEKAHAPFAKPLAHPLVAAAVNENDEPDFEIVDDGPTPAQILAAKKTHLLGLVTAAENETNEAVLPRGKRRLYDMRESDIRSGIVKPSLAAKIKSAIVGPETSMSADDEQFLKDQDGRRAQYAAIALAAAQAHSDIEDLTLDNIDAWQMPKLTD